VFPEQTSLKVVSTIACQTPFVSSLITVPGICEGMFASKPIIISYCLREVFARYLNILWSEYSPVTMLISGSPRTKRSHRLADQLEDRLHKPLAVARHKWHDPRLGSFHKG
jgi:hypothetical protein